MASETTIRQELAAATNGSTPAVAIAAINGPESVVLSGQIEALTPFCKRLEAAGVKTKQLTVSHAFHSPLMQPMVDGFKRVAQSINYTRPSIDIASNLTGQVSTEMATADYWCRHILEPVRFAEGIQALQSENCGLLLEIGPQPLLLGMAQLCWSGESPISLPSLRPGQSDWQILFESLAQLYHQGVKIDWNAVNQGYGYQRISLPTYAFQREIYKAEGTEKQFSNKSAQSTVIEAIQQGRTDTLSTLLADCLSLTTEQQAWLPTLLETLVQQHQAEALDDWFYTVEWQAQAIHIEPQTDLGHWLIFADRHGDEIATAITQQGGTWTQVYPQAPYQQLADRRWSIDPNQPDDYKRLLQEVTAQETRPLQGILHMWSLETEAPTADTLLAAQQLCCGSTLYLLQALDSLEQLASSLPKLWFVTQGSMPVDTESTAVAQSPLWGMGRVISLEYPQYWGGLCDLPTTDIAAEYLIAELQNRLVGSTEDHIALREENRYVARLVATKPEPTVPLPVRAASTYLITGGLGALGLQVAEWLVAQGASQLVLTSRRGPTAQTQERIAHLERQGAKVLVEQTDVTQTDDLQRLFTHIDETLPPLAGIVHAAGVGGAHAISDLTWETFAAVLQPKLVGAWNLHCLTQTRSLDFWISFSSISAVWGSQGLAHYAAANHFLDGLAHHRRQQGLPALSINWGPWAEGGMVATEDSQDWLSSRGLDALPPAANLTAMGHLLRSNTVQTTVANVDWSRFRRLYEVAGPRPLLSLLGESTAAPAKKQRDAIWQTLADAPLEDRQEQLVTYLQTEVGRVLKISDPAKLPRPQQGFFDMGMDSLMAVELKTQLETSLACSLPATLLIEAPSLEALANYLAKEILHWQTEVPESDNAKPTNQLATEVEQIAEEDVDALLAQELAELETLLTEE